MVYQFGPNNDCLREIEFDKKQKVFHVLKHVDDLKISNSVYENWVSERIIKLIVQNDGQFPDVTSVEK